MRLQLSAKKDLQSIWGVGKVIADKLYRAGFRSVEDVKGDLQKAVLLGLDERAVKTLRYYKDLQKRIPRIETDEMIKLFQTHLPDGFEVLGCELTSAQKCF